MSIRPAKLNANENHIQLHFSSRDPLNFPHFEVDNANLSQYTANAWDPLPGDGYETTTTYRIDDAGSAMPEIHTNGWSTRLFKVRRFTPLSPSRRSSDESFSWPACAHPS